MDTDTIAALSSGPPPAGVAVVRVSGPLAVAVAERLAGGALPVRRPVLRTLSDPASGEPIDRGLVLLFDGPGTATGEDVAEFHVHGGPAVIDGLLAALGGLEGVRLAEPGEFTRRAFLAGRMDLTEVEGLSDLIAAETAAQRRQALAQAGGLLRRAAEAWRNRLVAVRARVEAELDFADEGDVGEGAADAAAVEVEALGADMAAALEGARHGERVREGFRVAIVGPPNAGKSSLLNAIARRDVAIVTDVPGTTRDAIEVRLDLAGLPVTLVDTAGLRRTDDPVETIGVRRAAAVAAEADCVIELVDPSAADGPAPAVESDAVRLRVASKADLLAGPPPEGVDLAVSALDGTGLAALLDRLSRLAAAGLGGGETARVVRARQARHVSAAVEALDRAGAALAGRAPLEIVAEELRVAGDHLGRLSGRIDVEDVLDDIFSTFCIGK